MPNPGVFSLDLGANIGMFTLAVAAMGRKVKAVDATFKNLAYIRWNFFCLNCNVLYYKTCNN